MNIKSERFEMRLDQNIIEQVDNWRSEQADLPSRAEAIRRLVDAGLQIQFSAQSKKVSISDGEKLILGMLSGIYKGKKIKGDIDPEFIESSIYGGHYWALKWKYQGLLHDHEDSEDSLSEVVNILDMWSFIERAYEKLSQVDKKTFKEQTGFSEAKFIGFDGNNESEYLGIAKFLVEDMDRFSKFEGRDFNSHCQTIHGYRSMLSKFDDIRRTLVGRDLTCDEIINLYKLKNKI